MRRKRSPIAPCLLGLLFRVARQTVSGDAAALLFELTVCAFVRKTLHAKLPDVKRQKRFCLEVIHQGDLFRGSAFA